MRFKARAYKILASLRVNILRDSPFLGVGLKVSNFARLSCIVSLLFTVSRSLSLILEQLTACNPVHHYNPVANSKCVSVLGLYNAMPRHY